MAVRTSVLSGKVTAVTPPKHAWWGWYSANNADPSPYETRFGRGFDIAHFYADMSGRSDGAFPTTRERAVAARGDLLHIGWVSKVWGGTSISWAQVAAGGADSVIDGRAVAVRTFGQPMLIDFGHEMDGNQEAGLGTAAQFVAAFRHIHDRFMADGVTNVAWAWVPTGCSCHPDSTYRGDYPGDAYVDWIGWDPYAHTIPLPGFETIASSFYQRLDAGLLGAGAAAKPRLLSEYGVITDPARPSWIRAVPAALAAMPKLKAVEYFNASGAWNTSLDGDTASLDAFAAAGHAPYVSGK